MTVRLQGYLKRKGGGGFPFLVTKYPGIQVPKTWENNILCPLNPDFWDVKIFAGVTGVHHYECPPFLYLKKILFSPRTAGDLF